MTTDKYNPNIILICHGLWPSHDDVKFKKAAMELTAGLAVSDLKSHIRMDFTFYGMENLDDEYTVEVFVRDEFARWRYVGDIMFARNWFKKGDCMYETSELVGGPEEGGCKRYIFRYFKKPKCALADLLRRGNHTHDHRRGREILRP